MKKHGDKLDERFDHEGYCNGLFRRTVEMWDELDDLFGQFRALLRCLDIEILSCASNVDHEMDGLHISRHVARKKEKKAI